MKFSLLAREPELVRELANSRDVLPRGLRVRDEVLVLLDGLPRLLPARDEGIRWPYRVGEDTLHCIVSLGLFGTRFKTAVLARQVVRLRHLS